MKKILIIALFLSAGGMVFGQLGLSLDLGFQYGMARVADNGETLRQIVEPGVLLTVRFVPNTIGAFGRIGLLFPSKVDEGDLTLSYSQFKYILFINGGLGVSFKVPLNERFSFIFDAGASINDLLYGGSYTEDIDGSWEIKLDNIGQTYKGGHVFKNVKMSEVYNDVAVGLLGNAAIRFNFTPSIHLELAAAASFDFLRFKSYKFSADLSNDWEEAKKTFPAEKLDESSKKLILEKDMDFSVFKQFTIIPSISIGFTF
ncbi:MAG: hypothetical protein LBC31_11905 [Treponema sp.]|jgi:hypothetical protein|nr:hypothetical protein [Treponema sp.]